MTVKQVISMLEKCDPNAELLISADEEGNAYGTIERGSFAPSEESARGPIVVLYPWEEGIEI